MADDLRGVASGAGSGPKYQRLVDGITRLVDAGALRSGEKLPNEIDLSARTGLSLGTVQKALRILSEQRIVDRRHGHGTFVATIDQDQRDLWYFRFLSNAGGELLPISARAIDRRIIRQRGPWHDFLAADEVIRIRRLLDVAGRFSVLSDFYIDAERFRGVLDIPMPELHRVVLRSLLNQRFNAPTYHASQRIWCDRLPEKVCRLLGLPTASFGLMSDVMGRSNRDHPISMQRIYVPPHVSPIEIRG
ncbi:GntR family transcriptional regulator [Methylobacterium sp. C25]|uniref:GntR family transcriptional regulator n=1 Tax=Methylobacterium sp. C25 TaxID=2721622 RepID=UPI001F1E37D6|nr:GntR family transcriptional regulator [Methylobacterium sp. C25]